ncbi:MAG: hypothetical protein R3243_08515 [Arenibacter latericius]|nr:hypothetical protein [Arenibacter latericius]
MYPVLRERKTELDTMLNLVIIIKKIELSEARQIRECDGDYICKPDKKELTIK